MLASRLEQAMSKPHGSMDEHQDWAKEPADRDEYCADKTSPDARPLYPLITWLQARNCGSLVATASSSSLATALEPVLVARNPTRHLSPC